LAETLNNLQTLCQEECGWTASVALRRVRKFRKVIAETVRHSSTVRGRLGILRAPQFPRH
jgi:hypothetical protein